MLLKIAYLTKPDINKVPQETLIFWTKLRESRIEDGIFFTTWKEPLNIDSDGTPKATNGTHKVLLLSFSITFNITGRKRESYDRNFFKEQRRAITG